MGMTSEQIKQSLKPMVDFAPAVLAAANIVAAVEAAERDLGSLTEDCARMKHECAGLVLYADQQRDEIAKLALTVEEAKRAATTETVNLNRALSVIQGQIDSAHATLEATMKAHAAIMQQQDEELVLKRSQMNDVRNELTSLATVLAKHAG